MVPIAGYAHYKVDRRGNVYSFKRGKNGVKLKPQVQPHLRTVVYLYDFAGKRHGHAVSHLVANAFIPNPYKLPNVVHKNSDRADNRVSNLIWADAPTTHKVAQANDVYPQYKVKKAQAAEIQQMYATGMSMVAIAKKLNVTRQTVSRYLRLK